MPSNHEPEGRERQPGFPVQAMPLQGFVARGSRCRRSLPALFLERCPPSGRPDVHFDAQGVEAFARRQTETGAGADSGAGVLEEARDLRTFGGVQGAAHGEQIAHARRGRQRFYTGAAGYKSVTNGTSRMVRAVGVEPTIP